MWPRVLLAVTLLQISNIGLVETAKQQVQLSDSYLPVAMQIIAHLTDQMAYEVKDETPPPKSTTSKPVEQTTQHHKPGLYAPVSPPKPSDRISPKSQHRFVLLPMENNTEYTLIKPLEQKSEEPLLAAHNDEVQPLMDPTPNVQHLLPPHFDAQIDKISSRSDSYSEEEISEDSLQNLSQNVRDLIKMANDPNDERVVDVWEGLRANFGESSSRGKLSSSNLRLLLLYDLLSREAKRQKLSDYSGFSPDVMKALVESSGGGARAQLSLALSKMVERKDCGHDYANNRAKEMVIELGKDESKLSSELRYLQPLVYRN